MFYGPAASLFAVHALLKWSAALANETTILTNNDRELITIQMFFMCGSQITSHDFLIQSDLFKEPFTK